MKGSDSLARPQLLLQGNLLLQPVHTPVFPSGATRGTDEDSTHRELLEARGCGQLNGARGYHRAETSDCRTLLLLIFSNASASLNASRLPRSCMGAVVGALAPSAAS